ncbi:hypothetical protein SAZ10_33390 [Mesorhizobium sp. BAC0120]|uniref:hypothetical protein n=1 Tax=Mesorhizobium sp. BAC0120 TaxID=3090670 RepID=UPI00298D2A43|nr:hypothetical protein [Mesorhizobium sp. BAC0120]MDW6026664.1 hypothetical protein [Mesorhizobium sp. BAC0120]
MTLSIDLRERILVMSRRGTRGGSCGEVCRIREFGNTDRGTLCRDGQCSTEEGQAPLEAEAISVAWGRGSAGHYDGGPGVLPPSPLITNIPEVFAFDIDDHAACGAFKLGVASHPSDLPDHLVGAGWALNSDFGVFDVFNGHE